MGKIISLNNENGESLYPITSPNAVRYPDGSSIGSKVAAIEGSQDVKKVFATEDDLDGTGLTANDQVKVLADGDHEGKTTIYTWNGSTFTYVGSVGPYALDADVDNLESELTELASQAEGTYAKKNGYYESMTVGRAENLVDTKGDGTPQTFTRRTSAGTESIEDDGTALIKKIKGNTIVWNQLVTNGNFNDGINGWSKGPNTTQISIVESGIICCENDEADGLRIFRRVPFVVGHKLLITAQAKWYIDGSQSSFKHFAIYNYNLSKGLVVGDDVTENNWTKIAGIREITEDRSIGVSVYCNSVKKIYVKNVKAIDLTLMFGAGNEPATVEEFEAIFPNDYYAYNAGTLLSMNATAIKTVGFNQFNVTTGKANVLGGHQYQITGTYTALDIDGTAVTTDVDGLFTPSVDGVLTVTGGDGTTCVHLTWSGYRNGEYEAHWEQEKNIPTLTGGLKSVGSIHDEITSTQDIQRIGVRAYQSGDEDDTSVLTDKTNTQYVLAESIVTDYDEPRNLNYKVADFGTEEIVPQGVDGDGVPLSSPFVADIIYSNDFTRELVNLPKNYQSQDSMDAMLTAMGSALGFTWSKTYDTTNKRWTYTVTANQSES